MSLLVVATTYSGFVGRAPHARTRPAARLPPVRLLEPDFDTSMLSRRIGELKDEQSVQLLVLPECLLPGQRMRLSLVPEHVGQVLRSGGRTCVVGGFGLVV